jgi:hypothetical protein
MSAAALQKRAKRFKELVDGMIQESKLARGRKLGLSRQEILEYTLLLVNDRRARRPSMVDGKGCGTGPSRSRQGQQQAAASPLTPARRRGILLSCAFPKGANWSTVLIASRSCAAVTRPRSGGVLPPQFRGGGRVEVR